MSAIGTRISLAEVIDCLERMPESDERDVALDQARRADESTAEMEREVSRLREKNTELNRRATRAEGAVLEKVRNSDGSFGRSLANAAASAWEKRAEAERARTDRLAGALEDLIGAARGMPISHDNLCQGTLNHAIREADKVLSAARKEE